MTKTTCGFSIPKDGHIYIKEIIERCEDLISYGIWAGLNPITLHKWVANFQSDEERYFAACLLDSLIYRSEDQTIAMIKQLFQRTLPDLTRSDPMPGIKSIDWQETLKDSQDHGIRLVTVVKRSNRPTKSAYIIARLMKRHLSINEKWIITPWEVPKQIASGVSTFLFIDDFLGTGDQFSRVIKEENLESFISKAYVAYVPLAAHEAGIHNLTKLLLNLKIAAVETLDYSHSIFNTACSCFSDNVNRGGSARGFYYNLLISKNIYSPEYWLGYGNLELTYAFQHAAPDNSLSILWWAKNWNPLFNR